MGRSPHHVGVVVNGVGLNAGPFASHASVTMLPPVNITIVPAGEADRGES